MKEINLDNPIGAEKARQLPDPKGYRMLIMLPQMEEKTDIAFDREVNKYKSELDSIGVNPWSSKQWSN
jgi:hypothetical protein